MMARLPFLLALMGGAAALRVASVGRRSALVGLGAAGAATLLQQPALAKETFQQSMMRNAGVEVKDPNAAEAVAAPGKKRAEMVVVEEESPELSLEEVMAFDIAEKEARKGAKLTAAEVKKIKDKYRAFGYK